ncbi:MAG: hypothetical protein Q7R62_03205 [bacterium]|nr:hypothetical protein [bacterium]
MKNKTILHSLGHAVLVFLYVSGVVWIISHGEAIFGGEPESVWVPIMMLMLLVLSVAVMGALVLGRPILLYLSGAKSEALRFFVYTLAWIFVIMLVVFAFRPWQ